MTPDSLDQIKQIETGIYSNHHPYYHTLLIRIFINLGRTYFYNINDAIAAYCVFQIIIMAAVFSYAVMTLYEIGVSKKIIIPIFLFYAIMPFHIMYSCTVWKDVIFGGMVLLFTVSAYRCLQDIGLKKLNYSLFLISSILCCLFRSNGFFVYIFLTISYITIFKFRKKALMGGLMIFVVLLVIFMKYPLLKRLNVAPPDTIEGLAIPTQQIARIIVDDDDLREDEKKLLSEIIDINKVKICYKPYIVDPVKELVRQKNNQQYLVDHKNDFVKLYISLGLRHVDEYFKAWIDETKGYWNSGYVYWRWADEIYENDLGLHRTIKCPILNFCMQAYCAIFENSILVFFISIGLYTWINLICLFIALKRKDKIGIFILLPGIFVVLSLLIATPVYSEFRYAYALFCIIPIIMVLVLRPIIQEKTTNTK